MANCRNSNQAPSLVRNIYLLAVSQSVLFNFGWDLVKSRIVKNNTSIIFFLMMLQFQVMRLYPRIRLCLYCSLEANSYLLPVYYSINKITIKLSLGLAKSAL